MCSVFTRHPWSTTKLQTFSVFEIWADSVTFSIKSTLFLILFLFAPLFGDELTIDPPEIWKSDCYQCRPADLPPPPPVCDVDDNVIVDLIDPLYENGTLTTVNGGILTATNLRIQAQKITYVRKLDDENPTFTVFCEGNILIDYLDWVLVGDSLSYDFLTHKGYLINGRTAVPPWYIGGRKKMTLW